MNEVLYSQILFSPGERFAAEKVNMQMVHGLSRVLTLIDDEAVPFRKSQRRRKRTDFLEGPAEECGASVVRLGEEREVLLRHAEQVHLCNGRNVLEDDYLVVLVHLGGGNFPRDNLTKNAVFQIYISFMISAVTPSRSRFLRRTSYIPPSFALDAYTRI